MGVHGRERIVADENQEESGELRESRGPVRGGREPDEQDDDIGVVIQSSSNVDSLLLSSR